MGQEGAQVNSEVMTIEELTRRLAEIGDEHLAFSVRFFIGEKRRFEKQLAEKESSNDPLP